MRFQYCLITDRKQCRQPLHELAEQADAAKVDYFQLRDKNLEAAELLNLARHVRPLFAHAQFIVNGRLEVALACGADGVHLQDGNIPIRAVRRKYPKMIIGYSAHTREELRMAEESGADYAFLSPIFPPRSKTNGKAPLGAETLSAWIEELKIPVFALGGISAANVKELRKCGCAGVAGISFFLQDGKFDSSGMVIR
jgi:thiamine-phosphate pyrophosphorylase